MARAAPAGVDERGGREPEAVRLDEGVLVGVAEGLNGLRGAGVNGSGGAREAVEVLFVGAALFVRVLLDGLRDVVEDGA